MEQGLIKKISDSLNPVTPHYIYILTFKACKLTKTQSSVCFIKIVDSAMQEPPAEQGIAFDCIMQAMQAHCILLGVAEISQKSKIYSSFH